TAEKVRVKGPVSLEAHQVSKPSARDRGKEPTHQQFVIALQRKRPHRTIQNAARIKGVVQRAIRVQPRQSHSSRAVELSEIAGGIDFIVVGLKQQRIDLGISAGIIKTCVDGTGLLIVLNDREY